jgi:hypothetical protein
MSQPSGLDHSDGRLAIHRDTVARHPRSPQRKPKSGPVTVLLVDPKVWRHALDMADGDVRRLQIVDETTVVIHNGPAARH